MTDVVTGTSISVTHTREGAVVVQILDDSETPIAQALMNPITASLVIDKLFVETEAAARAVTAPKGSC